VSPRRALGLALGLVGVAVVTGIHPSGGWWAIAGALAIVASSLSYASAGVYGQLAVSGTAGPILATGSMLVGGLILLPFASLPAARRARPSRGDRFPARPDLLGTAFAQLVLYRLLALHGSGAPVARHVPDARLRARLRCADPRRAAHVLDGSAGSR
jgi:drug/metabolite transporter (DMT)-like permease